MAVSIAIGDQVHCLNETGGGEVIALSGNMATVRDADGFEWEYATDELILASEMQTGMKTLSNLELSHLPKGEQGGRTTKSKSPRRKKRKAEDVMEIDLHLHELTEYDAGMGDGEKLRLQMLHFVEALERAREEKKSFFIAIHGRGKGVLRHEIRSLLDGREDCSYEDADPRRYGLGATKVLLH